jgi:hypothetical protein
MTIASTRVSAWRRSRLIAAAALLSAMSFAVAAPSVFDFDDWMQRIDDGSQDLQRHIAARDRDAASNAARELEELYGLMQTFFENRDNAVEAVRYSREGREFATRALRNLAAGRFDAARGNALAIAHACRDCHSDYKPL